MEKKKFTKPELKIVTLGQENILQSSTPVSQAKGITFEDLSIANGGNSYGF